MPRLRRIGASVVTAVLIGHFEPGSPEWHTARAAGLGGSEIAPVLGLSPFESRFSLWHRKAGLVGPVEESPEMEWGKRLEAAVLRKYREQHPELDFRTVNGTFAHPERPWQIANPDLLAVDRVIEAKCSAYGDGYGEPGTDQIPVYYRCQVLWYLDVLGLQRADLAVLVGGNDYCEYTIWFDETEAQILRSAAVEFLDTLANGVLPDVDAHGATYQAIREIHPDIDGTDVDLDDHTAETYIRARRAVRAAEEAEQLAKNRLADAMGNAKRALWDGQPIATRQARGDSTPYLVAARNVHERDINPRSSAA